MAFSALSVDYGVMWSSRRQAQNAADAAAHAGAVSLAFDSPSDFERARAVAETVGESNRVFGGTLNIDRGAGEGDNADPALDISFPHDGAAAECPTPLTGGTCVRANVYRNEGNNPLPTFFGHHLRPDGARGPSYGNGADRQRQCDRLPEAVGGGRPMGGKR